MSISSGASVNRWNVDNMYKIFQKKHNGKGSTIYDKPARGGWKNKVDSCQSEFYALRRISLYINKHVIGLNCSSFRFYEYLMQHSNEIVLK